MNDSEEKKEKRKETKRRSLLATGRKGQEEARVALRAVESPPLLPPSTPQVLLSCGFLSVRELAREKL